MNPEPKDKDEKKKEKEPNLSDEISADELAMLLGDDASSLHSPGSSSQTLGDLISADELTALGLPIETSTPPPQAKATVESSTSVQEPKYANSSAGSSAANTSTAASLSSATATATAPAPPKYDGLTPANDRADTDTGIDLLLDVPLKVSVELGRITMTLQQILELGRGSIVELERLAGEPVDILVNDKLIAHGEVVVIDEYFGVKITELIEPKG